MSYDPPTGETPSGRGFAFAVVASRYNGKLVDRLLEAVLQVLAESGVLPEDQEVVRVPGANEVPYACGMLADTKAFDAIIALGVVIAGDTKHHELIGQSTAFILQQMAFDTGVPIINGILVVDDLKQAEVRVTGKLARGAEFARAALEMASLKVDLQARLDDVADGEDAQFDELLDEDDDADNPWKS